MLGTTEGESTPQSLSLPSRKARGLAGKTRMSMKINLGIRLGFPVLEF